MFLRSGIGVLRRPRRSGSSPHSFKSWGGRRLLHPLFLLPLPVHRVFPGDRFPWRRRPAIRSSGIRDVLRSTFFLFPPPSRKLIPHYCVPWPPVPAGTGSCVVICRAVLSSCFSCREGKTTSPLMVIFGG